MTRQPALADGEPTLVSRVEDLSRTAHGTRQLATVRIALALAWLFTLLREFPRHRAIWGPDAPWSWELSERRLEATGAFSVLRWSDSGLWFEAFYLLSLAVACCLLIGWRTRTASVLFMVCVLSLAHRNDSVTNAGDLVLRLAAIYLIFTRCGTAWSVDSRKAARRPERGDPVGLALGVVLGLVLTFASLTALLSPGWALAFWVLYAGHALWWSARRRPQLRATLEMIGNLLHNGALLMIMVQVCLIYATAGWYKIQGAVWQDGTAVYWSTHIDWLTPFPSLSDALTSNSTLVLILTYGTVFVQVGFLFSLLNRRAKNILLILLIGEHVGIGILLGLQAFSLAVIAVDLVFLPTTAVVWCERWAARVRDAVHDRGKVAVGTRTEVLPEQPEDAAALLL